MLQQSHLYFCNRHGRFCHSCSYYYFSFGEAGFIFHLRGPNFQKVLDNNVLFCDDGRKYVLLKSAALGETKPSYIRTALMWAPLLVTKPITRWRLPSVVMHVVMPKGDSSRLCKSSEIASNAKLNWSHAFGRSTLFYNVSAIFLGPKQSLKRFNNAHANLYRAATMKKSESNELVEHVCNVKIFKRHSVAMCDQMLCIHRLKYLRRIILHAPPLLKQMLAYEWSIMDPLSWTTLLVSDLRRLRDTCAFLTQLPDPAEDPLAWHEFIVNHEADFLCGLSFLADVYVEPTVECVAHCCSEEQHQCEIRRRVFATKQVLSAQNLVKHGNKAVLRNTIVKTFCLCCMKQFHTRSKLHHHIAYLNQKCRRYYLEQVVDCDPEEVSLFEEQETVLVRKLVKSSRSKIYHPLKPVRIPGPLHVINYVFYFLFA